VPPLKGKEKEQVPAPKRGPRRRWASKTFLARPRFLSVTVDGKGTRSPEPREDLNQGCPLPSRFSIERTGEEARKKKKKGGSSTSRGERRKMPGQKRLGCLQREKGKERDRKKRRAQITRPADNQDPQSTKKLGKKAPGKNGVGDAYIQTNRVFRVRKKTKLGKNAQKRNSRGKKRRKEKRDKDLK